MLVLLFSHLIEIYAAYKTELLNRITIMYQDFYHYHQAQTLSVLKAVCFCLQVKNTNQTSN